MKFQKRLILLFIFPLAFAPLFAQESDPRGVLVYAEDETLIQITDAAGNSLEVYLGMDIPAGSSVHTGATTAELQLEPNGSILKLAMNTIMTVDTLQKGTTGSNNLSVKSGKIRAVIARLTDRQDSYNFFSRNTVCGIRGTDFILDANDVLAVADGAVDFTKSATGEVLQVSGGNMVRGGADIFTLTTMTTDEMDSLFSGLQFKQLNPADVPGHKPAPLSEQPAEAKTIAAEPEPTPDPNLSDSTPDRDRRKTDADPANDPIMRILGGVLAMEVGSFSVDGVTYSKLLFQPTFRLGKLQASLYLPFIYDQNLFDPEDWYRPEGNYEWSFGTDQEDNDEIIEDLFQDLFLKIRYLKWGKQRDPFYFAFGSYSNVRLGHGILMNNYENNSEFPAVRKVGLNMGAYGEKADIEIVGEDFSTPIEQVLGARLAFAVAGPISLGFSGAADLDPTQDLDPVDDATYIEQDPIILNFAVDLDFPLVERSALTMLFYADAASLMPIVDGEPETDFFLDEDDIPRNYGTSAGVMGNLLSLDYQLEYQYADGVFRHGYYNSTYDRIRGARIKEILDELNSPTDEDPRQGIYGSAGFTLAQILYFYAGYDWLWSADGPDLENDYLELELSLKPDVIPVLGIYGSLGYSRTGFAAAIDEDRLSFMDDKTTFMGEVVYPISEYLDVALVLASVLERDEDGSIIYGSDGYAESNYSMTLDVRLSY
ncbi:MAG: hypothetical protein PQJ59_03880 [Spirochaetales bacterium]|nr:hypothetical protein [Spirochaetales bacterium]